MSSEVWRVNRDNIEKIAIILVVSLVIIATIFFIISIIKKGNDIELKRTVSKKIDIKEECTFDVSLRNFNRLSNNVSALKLCSDYNKIIINDVTLNEENANLYIIYYNGELEVNNTNLGIYLNDKQITKGASFDERNIIRIYDNMLFIKKEDIKLTNIVVYNAKGKQKYDFAYALNSIILKDKAFKDKRIYIDDVDVNSYIFDEGEFTFETTSECTSTQEYKGSKYKVTYKNEKFKKPEFVEKISC